MDAEQFYSQFNGLDAQIEKLSDTLKQAKEKIGILEKNLGAKRVVEKVLRGLKTTPKQNDPGKYSAAYHFVREIMEGDIKGADEPSLYKTCPTCHEERAVVMSYEQTEDGPSYDEWVKTSFCLVSC